jgi:hypothetical protein
MLTIAVPIKELFNSFVSSVGFDKAWQWFRVIFVSLFLFTLLLPTSWLTEQLVSAGNATCSWLMVSRYIITG